VRPWTGGFQAADHYEAIRKRVAELPPPHHAQSAEYGAQVIFDDSRADEQLGAGFALS